MRSLATLSAAAAALLVVSIGAKALVMGRPEPVERTAPLLRNIAGALRQSGFGEVTVSRDGYVTALRATCHVKARPFSPYGTDRLSIPRLGAAFGPTRYGYAGTWRSDPPKLRPLLAYYLQRELARVGIVTRRQAIAAASTTCPLPDALTRLTVTQR